MIKANRRSMKLRRKFGRRILLGTAGTVLLVLGVYQTFFASEHAVEDTEGDVATRKLSSSGCGDFEMPLWTVPLFVLATLWVFDGLAVVCDEYFQPSLEAISDALGLSPDVAGATFLAAGSSAPELFTSFGDTFGPGNSIGMGTIVGSAMFNILVIVALSAFVAAKSGASLQIDWRPVSRDVVYYSLSIFLLTIFFLDGEVVLWESIVMVLGYVSYIVFMMFNEQILGKCNNSYKVSPSEQTDQEKEMERRLSDALASEFELKKAQKDIENAGEGDDADKNAGGEHLLEDRAPSAVLANSPEEEEEEEDENIFAFPDDPFDKFMHVLTLPFLAVFHVSIPKVDKPAWETWYWTAFVMSIIWIGVLCHFMVDFATRIACTIHVSPIILGLLVLAVGTSVPDAIGSMIAAREGEADMAIANAVGSNVFDILLGLGLPWMLYSIMFSESNVVDRDGVFVAVIILFITVLLFVGVLMFNKWKMNKVVGLGLFGLYVAYVLFTIISASIS